MSTWTRSCRRSPPMPILAGAPWTNWSRSICALAPSCGCWCMSKCRCSRKATLLSGCSSTTIASATVSACAVRPSPCDLMMRLACRHGTVLPHGFWPSCSPAALESANPFAVVVMAHAKHRATRRDPQARLAWKLDLTKSLYRRGYDRSQVIALYRFLKAWVMTLQEAMAAGSGRQEQSSQKLHQGDAKGRARHRARHRARRAPWSHPINRAPA